MRNQAVTRSAVLLAATLIASVAQAQPRIDPGRDRVPPTLPSPAGELQLEGLTLVTRTAWNTAAVRRVLQSFAFGGMADEAHILAWSNMPPEQAIVQMLDFEAVNARLSPPDGGTAAEIGCTSLTDLQNFWSSDAPDNPVRESDRPYHVMLYDNDSFVTPVGLILTWGRAMHTRGCNPFLHRMAFYLTNYHASIHIQNAGVALIRDYYDDMVSALVSGADFVGLMYHAARNGALAFAYGHALNYVHPQTGAFVGNDDFAREYFQLLFSIQGTSEDPDYHENVSIENNARLLTGMMLDQVPDRFGSTNPGDWFVSGIDFTDHQDAAGRRIYNRTAHYEFRMGDESCLEILHQRVCGATADAKLLALGPVAAAHPESMANTPLKLIRFFADAVIDETEAAALRTAWVDAEWDLLRFLRAYAISTLFHDPGRVQYWSAFERNLIVHNANTLDNEESFARAFYAGPTIRMIEQGALVFAPIRDVFGGQTGTDAANDRFVFKNAWTANVNTPGVLAQVQEEYRDGSGEAERWQKRWDEVVPPDPDGVHRVGSVADWLWNRFIADGGQNFDVVAKAQTYSLLATGFDFGALVDPERLDARYTSDDLSDGELRATVESLAGLSLDLSDLRVQYQIGMAVNFITMLPYAFAAEGGSP
ncbi:DUF1800 family protein [Elongatibacter sediminis]|uniref:DUF1800 family protein n=1 Tax=Elongatibacter sediminis TaxID=3119006 RepID=A0AAW9RBT0_9GAMM